MYFDFEDLRPDTPTIEGAISRREALFMSVGLHVLVVVLAMLLPSLPVFRELEAARAERQAELMRQLEAQQQRDSARFVFVQPRVDIEAPRPPEQGELSDRDRMARAPERAVEPTNPLPFSRGNTPERIETERTARARGEGPAPEPALGNDGGGEEGAEEDARREGEAAEAKSALDGLRLKAAEAARGTDGRAATPGGSLGNALRNLEQYVTPEVFDNLAGGGGQFGPWIQFDTKGVEFGPWIRRFIAQIKRNWFIPYAAMSLKGHVVITFNVHKDGAITDLAVQKPSDVESFTTAAFNALQWSNPTQPLPPEYPSDAAFFTVTFFYNETPPTP